MDKYEIIIYWSEADNIFVAEVPELPELPGCMAHGSTQEQALANTKDAIQLWIDTARETGGREAAIDGVFYHFERIKKEVLQTEYRVDNDPDYEPQSDPDGYCYILAPYCK